MADRQHTLLQPCKSFKSTKRYRRAAEADVVPRQNAAPNLWEIQTSWQVAHANADCRVKCKVIVDVIVWCTAFFAWQLVADLLWGFYRPIASKWSVLVSWSTQADQHHHFNSGCIPRSHHCESCTFRSFRSGVMQIIQLYSEQSKFIFNFHIQHISFVVFLSAKRGLDCGNESAGDSLGAEDKNPEAQEPKVWGDLRPDFWHLLTLFFFTLN